jgi:hypothetical protein
LREQTLHKVFELTKVLRGEADVTLSHDRFQLRKETDVVLALS